MRNRTIAVSVLGLAAALLVVPKAEAQVVLRGGLGGPRVFVGAGGPVALTPGYGYNSSYVPPGYVPPYSYYAVPLTVPARLYEGPSAFPFYGRPYGQPFDRWTWPYISGGADANLARYYYPPLGF